MTAYDLKLEAAADYVLNVLVDAVTARDDADQAARVKDAELRNLLEHVLPHLDGPWAMRRALHFALAEADRTSLLAEAAREHVWDGVPA